MADTLIKDLTAKTTVVASDELCINDVAGGNLDKKEGMDDIKTYMSLSPVLVTPALGTPSAGVLTSCTGLPMTTGVTGTLPVANGGTGVTTKTGTGAVVLSTSPTLVTPILGTPTSGALSNCTLIPVNQGTGVLPDASMPNLTGDVTTVEGAVATTIGADKVLLSMVAPAAKTEFIAIALGDESTVLAAASTTVPVVTYHMPYGFTLTNVKVGLTAAGTGAALATFDVHEAGTTVLSTKVTVDASEKTSGTVATQPVISDSALAADSLIEIFVDLVDTDNVAAGAKVYLIGYQT